MEIRSLVIVVRRHYDNSIKTIRVHDLLRDLAINRAEEGNFITVFSNKDVDRSMSREACHVAIQSNTGRKLMKHASPNLC